jgi:hypothetical protein
MYKYTQPLGPIEGLGCSLQGSSRGSKASTDEGDVSWHTAITQNQPQSKPQNRIMFQLAVGFGGCPHNFPEGKSRQSLIGENWSNERVKEVKKTC